MYYYNCESTHICVCIYVYQLYVYLPICGGRKRPCISNVLSPNSGRTIRSPPQSYLHITIQKNCAKIICLHYKTIKIKIHVNLCLSIYATHRSSNLRHIHTYLHQHLSLSDYYLFTCNIKKH